MWLCLCILRDGSAEETEWLTQDDADQMAAETETAWEVKGLRACCAVGPIEARDEVAAVAQILAEEQP